MAKMGETLTGTLSFLFVFIKFLIWVLLLCTFKLLLGRFSDYSAYFIHSPCQTGSQPMSGRLFLQVYHTYQSIMHILIIIVILLYTISTFYTLDHRILLDKVLVICNIRVYVLYVTHYIFLYNAFDLRK